MLQDISEQQRILLPYMIRPDRALHLLRPGRLVRVREGPNDWGWGIVLAVRAAPTANGKVRPMMSPVRSSYHREVSHIKRDIGMCSFLHMRSQWAQCCR